MIRIHMYY